MARAGAEGQQLPEELRIEALPAPGERFRLGERLGAGVYSEVYEAVDLDQGGRRVAVKVTTLTLDVAADVREEYSVLRRLCAHPNLPQLYGAFLHRAAQRRDPDQLWLVMELCEGGPVMDLVAALHKQGRRMSEEHIAYILKETAKGLWHLHENHVVHRDVKGSNILLTKDGEVKLVDFGLSRELTSTLGKSGTALGSPCWMAPEVVTARDASGYDNRADVWALGIVAIELADGRPPFHDMHPTRALFQITRNPPPTAARPSAWSQLFNDFVSECLTKNPEHRPYMVEILEHPFLTEQQQNEYTLQQDLRALASAAAESGASLTGAGRRRRRPLEVALRGGRLQASHTAPPEPLHVEDLAALEPLHDDALLEELLERRRRGQLYTFAGDVLLALGADADAHDDDKLHPKYRFKSRAENAPHPFAVADRALQDALHHEQAQHVLLAGEARSGKSTVLRQLLRHLAFLGKTTHDVGDRVERSLWVLNAFGNAATPTHADSTRHLLQLQLTFSRTGKLSGALFGLSMLEKWRVCAARDDRQANFHVFYYLVDGLEAEGGLRQLGLEAGRSYCALRRREGAAGAEGEGEAGAGGPRSAPRAQNAAAFARLRQELREALGLEEAAQEALWAALAAVVLLAELRFDADPADPDAAVLRNPEIVDQVARLLCVEARRLGWALLNYCVVSAGAARGADAEEQRRAVRRRHSPAEAAAARDALAATLYARLVHWLAAAATWRLSFTRAVYGDQHVINLVDMFGFECQRENGLEQLFVNTLNEQMQYYYNQRVFAWELQEHQEEGLEAPALRYADNKATLDALLARPSGLLHLLDDPALAEPALFLGALRRSGLAPHVSTTTTASAGARDFSVAHYTGTVCYRADGLYRRNRDFLPPDLVEVLRQSEEPVLQQLFTARLTRAGGLALGARAPEGVIAPAAGAGRGEGGGGGGGGGRRRWGAALMGAAERPSGAGAGPGAGAAAAAEASRGRFSQSRGQRTAGAVFRAAGLEVLRALAGGGLHAVRCVRASLANGSANAKASANAPQPELVRQQLRALAVLDTARARRDGFPCRVPFAEFLRRYKFLAFEFDEQVEESKDNCRLLLVRLKMEGWRMGRTKVFLTYYNEEYLARLYETQVKKIVRVQTMLRAFLARRVVQKKTQEQMADKKKADANVEKNEKKEIKAKDKSKENKSGTASELDQEAAALIIQKQYRGYRVRKQTGPALQRTPIRELDETTLELVRGCCRRWRARTIFQVLLLYRAARRHDLVYFCQQVHVYSQQAAGALRRCQGPAPLEHVDGAARAATWLARPRPAARKLPFRLCDEPFFADADAEAQRVEAAEEAEGEAWDAPLRRADGDAAQDDVTWPGARGVSVRDQEVQTGAPSAGPRARAAGGAAAGAALGPAAGAGGRDPRLNTLARAPFRRDAGALDALEESARRPAPRPTPSAGFAVGLQAGRMNSPGPGSSPGHRKQKAPPPPPYDAVAVQRPLGPGGAGAPHAIPRGIGGGGGGGGGARTKDHVAELQALGRRGGAYGDDSDEEPPFNFKGMLRKTNCNRPSFRRSTDTSKEDSIYGPSTTFRGHRDFVMPKNTSNNNNVTFNQNDSKTEKSCISKSDDKSSLSCNNNNNNWKSDEIWDEEPGRLMNNSRFGKSSEILTHKSRKENVGNNIELYSKQILESPTKKQREILASNNINSNTVSGLPGENGITELAPGIRIQGQVAEL